MTFNAAATYRGGEIRMEDRMTAAQDRTLNLTCPSFGVGQSDGVSHYVEQALPILADRLGFNSSEFNTLVSLTRSSLQDSIALMEKTMSNGLVEPTHSGRQLFGYLGNHLVTTDSTITGMENLQTALEFQRAGGNVLLIQNHRSGADTLVMEVLLERFLERGITSQWAYMSGHVVNLFLLPLTFFVSALRRFQIFSAKYRSDEVLTGVCIARMMRQNTRALRCLGKFVERGGKLVVLYPEGGRGDGCMKRGEPETTKVAELISSTSPRGLMILPTYVDGSTNIHPVFRGPNEFNEILMRVQRGTAHLKIGRPAMWSDMHPPIEAVEVAARSLLELDASCSSISSLNSKAIRLLLCDTMMGLIAALAPNEEEMGPYSHPDFRCLVEELV